MYTRETSIAHARFEELFAALQEVRHRIHVVREAGSQVDVRLYQEWETTLQAFREAYGRWREVKELQRE